MQDGGTTDWADEDIEHFVAGNGEPLPGADAAEKRDYLKRVYLPDLARKLLSMLDEKASNPEITEQMPPVTVNAITRLKVQVQAERF